MCVCVQVALVSKVEEEHRRFTVAKGKPFPPLVVCVFSAGSCACTGKSNERELIQTYTESESASLLLWSVLTHTHTAQPNLIVPALPTLPALPSTWKRAIHTES